MSLLIYSSINERLQPTIWAPGDAIGQDARWIDMLCPTREEEEAIELFIGAEVPTPEEMRAIEVSERLYREGDTYYMTVSVLTKVDVQEPSLSAVTFILNRDRLVTLRYAEPLPFAVYARQVPKLLPGEQTPAMLFIGLIDAITNRLADILERVAHDIDDTNMQIFPLAKQCTRAPNYQDVLKAIGRVGDLMSKARESLATLERLIAFIPQCAYMQSSRELIAAQAHDVAGLNDHAHFLTNKISFLLDATLGMISFEQNNIIKIFSVAAVMFLPPTLIASIYGMNFDHMPELHWRHGYPITLLLMVISAALPYFYFKRKKWL